MPIVTGKTPEGLIKHAQKDWCSTLRKHSMKNGGMSREPLATN